MKKILTIGLVVLIAAAMVNDIGRYFTVLYNLDLQTREMSQKAADVARKRPGDKYAGWPTARAVAMQYGITVTGYAQTEQLVVVSTAAPVSGTWVTGPIVALSSGRAWNEPFDATGRAESYYR